MFLETYPDPGNHPFFLSCLYFLSYPVFSQKGRDTIFFRNETIIIGKSQKCKIGRDYFWPDDGQRHHCSTTKI